MIDFIRKKNRHVLRLEEYELENGDVLPLLHFPLLEQSGIVSHCFTTRLGGVSEGIYSSLNLSFIRGDDQGAVEENFRRIAEALGAPLDHFVCSDQTHTTNVKLAGPEDAGNGLVREKSFFDTDGLITNMPGLVLSTFYADCVPLFFVDAKHRAIGLSHSGWKGTLGRIGAATIESMKSEFGTEPQDLLCAIGPSICRDCYEVSEDVAEEFYREFASHGQAGDILSKNAGGKYQLDLWRANELIMRQAGVPPSNIALTDICTCCNPESLFSHRASRGMRGSLGAFLSIKR